MRQDEAFWAVAATATLFAGLHPPRVSAQDPPAAAKLEWIPAAGGGCGASGITATSTILEVPAQYQPASGVVKLFVKRYAPSGAKSAGMHLIMLAGGPGQDVTVLEGHACNIIKYVGVPVMVYLADMRGVGQSSAFVRPEDASWLGNIDGLSSSAPFPLTSLTLTNAAMDVLQVAKAVRDSSEFASGGKLGVFGVSFGGTWAYRVLQLDATGLFDFAVLDSMAATTDGFVNPTNDSALLDNCNDHPFCKAQFGGDATQARKWISEILDPQRNACTAALNATLNGGKYVAEGNMTNRLIWALQELLEGAQDMSPEGRYHSAMLALAFVKTTHQCRDAAAYAETLKTVTGGSASFGASAGAVCGEKQQYNRVANYILFCEEAFNFAGGGDGNCASPSLTGQCMLRSAYSNLFTHISRVVSPRDPIASRAYSGKAKVYFVHGEADLVTPHPAADRLAGRLSGARKIYYRNLGHSIISNGPCAVPIWQEILAGGSSSATDGCLKRINGAPLEWTFKAYPKYRAWWDPSIDPDDYPVAEPDLASASGGLTIPWIPILVAVAVILLVGGGGALFTMRRRAQKTA